MNIGLVPMSAKPYHIGHHKLIQIAADQNDKVFVFVSFSGRGVKSIKDPSDPRTIKGGARKIEAPKAGEVPVFGADMRHIWLSILKDELDLPESVEFIFPDFGSSLVPVRCVHETCTDLIESHESFEVFGSQFSTKGTVINIYSDVDDISTNYSNDIMEKYYGVDWSRVINLVGIRREDTVNISGSEMRAMLKDVSRLEEFKSLLPPIKNNAKNIIASILYDSAASGIDFNSRRKSASKAPMPVYAG